MLRTVLRVTWLELRRDSVALALTFVLPIVFFSIFASVFASMDPGGLEQVEVTVVADDDASFAASIADRLESEERLEVRRVGPEGGDDALAAVRRGEIAVVVLLPSELRPSAGPPMGPGAGSAGVAVEIHADRSNPLATGLVQGLVQSAAAAAAMDAFAGFGAAGAADGEEGEGGLVPVEVVDALGRTGKRPSVAFFAAGLGVLFLLFAVTGRSSILLEERESGVLSRLLATRLGLGRLLAGRWLFLTALGSVQVGVMFLWAALVFGLDLFTPRALAGAALVTVATAAAAAAFGLLLASLCRTRAQLQGVAVVVILSLAAVGGNMFPSFLMPERLQAVGRLLFNHWALVAYQKIFWYERPVADLLPEVAALAAAAAVFFGLTVAVARRWLEKGGLAT